MSRRRDRTRPRPGLKERKSRTMKRMKMWIWMMRTGLAMISKAKEKMGKKEERRKMRMTTNRWRNE